MARGTAVAEEILLRAVGSEGPLPEEVREGLERLLDELVETLGSMGARPTDGLILRRDAVHPSGFWALGKAYLLEAPYEEPVWVEFAFNPARDYIVSGRVLFGIRDQDLGGVRRTKLDDMLLAYLLEVVETVPWRHAFTRSASGWTKAES